MKKPSKLTLKRETVRPITLSQHELQRVQGGQRPVEEKTYVLTGHPAWCCA